MNQKTGMKRRQSSARSEVQDRKSGGGAATAGGMNFQAAVTAIAGIHMLAGHALGWLDGIVKDQPLAVWSETGGAGDDLRFELGAQVLVEIQIKKGLQKGTKLWDALLNLARAIGNASIHYGVLVVSGTSSGTISEELANDVRCIGDGRMERLNDISIEFIDRLRKENLDPEQICACLRIATVHARADECADIGKGKFILSHLCGEKKGAAWDRLYGESTFIPERRGRWTVESLTRMLRAADVMLSHDVNATSSILTLSKLIQWTVTSNSKFSIPAANVALPIRDAWIALKTKHSPDWANHPIELPLLLQRYRDTGERSSALNNTTLFDAEWTGYFRPRSVVLAGPGMGKTTLMTRLANLYGSEGYPVLKVSLKRVVIEMRHGKNFTESVFSLGLEGVPQSLANDILRADFREWVILCDGLDETRSSQGEVAEAMIKFSVAYPLARIVVTSRPIGYTTGLLADWSHYELLRLDEKDGVDNLCQLLLASSPKLGSLKEAQSRLAESIRGRDEILGTLITPQLLGMAAGLIVHGHQLGSTKVQIYDNYFRLLEKESNARTGETREQPFLRRLVFELICWEIMVDPIARADDILQRAATSLAPEFKGSRLEARDSTVKCLEHWEQLGILETLHYGLNELIAASHQTFAEFGAARRLANMKLEDRSDVIRRSLDNPAWVEVFRFAAGLGLADELISEMLSRVDEDPALIERALCILADNGSGVSVRLRVALLERAKLCIQSAFDEHTYAVGLALGNVCHFIPAAEELLVPLRSSNLRWTQAIAYLCALEAGRGVEVLDEIERVVDSLEKLPRALGHDVKHRLQLGLLSKVIESRPRDEAQAYLDKLVNKPDLSLRTGMDVAAYAEHKGFMARAPWLNSEAMISMLTPPPKYNKAKAIEMNLLLRAAISKRAHAKPETKSGSRSLQHWRAFVQITGLLESESGDTLAWLEPSCDTDAAEEVLRALLALSPIDSGQLAADAVQVPNRAKKNPYLWIPDMSLDITLNWQLATGLKINRAKLEAALSHPARWVVDAASSILAVLPAPSIDCLTQILQKSHGYGFGGVAKLIKLFYPQDAARIMFSRLEGPTTPGLEFVLAELEKLNLPWSKRLDELLNCLASAQNPHLATQAQQFKLKYFAQ